MKIKIQEVFLFHLIEYMLYNIKYKVAYIVIGHTAWFSLFSNEIF